MNIFEMSLAASILIVLVVVIRSLAMHKLPKKMFLILWGVIMLRLLVPISISIPISVPFLYDFSFNHFLDGMKTVKSATVLEEAGAETINGAAYTEDMSLGKAVGEDIAIERTASGISKELFYLIWIMGTVLLSTLFLMLYLRSREKLKQALPLNEELPQYYMDKFPKRHKVGLYLSDRISTPITYGILRPQIILPKSMQAFFNEKETIEYIIYHELVHIERLDNFWKIISMIIVCIHWFNPLVWVMCILFNRDLEISCDEKVIAIFGNDKKENYALALIELAQKRAGVSLLYSGFGKSAIKERIVLIMKYKKTTIIASIMAVILIVASAAVFLTFQNKSAEVSAMEAVNVNDSKADEKTEWWTYEEYAKMLKQRKKDMQKWVENGSGYYDAENKFHKWTQEEVDKEVKMYEETLQEIKDGIKEEKKFGIENETYMPSSVSENDSNFSNTEVIGNIGEKQESSTSAESTYAIAIEEGNGKFSSDVHSWIKEFEKYGLTIDENEQLYFNEKPVYFIADNQRADSKGFSGSVYVNNDGEGATGVITVHDAKGNIMGLQELSEKESKEYSEGHW